MTTEISNRTITDADLARASAILDVDRKTRALMQLVPKAGMGSYVVTDPSGWSVEITRGEAGCGDAHRFRVAAKLLSQRNKVACVATSELLIVARRGAAHIDIPGITVGQIGDFGWGRVHDMLCRIVGTLG